MTTRCFLLFKALLPRIHEFHYFEAAVKEGEMFPLLLLQITILIMIVSLKFIVELAGFPLTL
jgi:hypothetical protein